MNRASFILSKRERHLTLRSRIVVSCVLAGIFIITTNVFLATLLRGDLSRGLNTTLETTALSVAAAVDASTNPAALHKELTGLGLTTVVALTTPGKSAPDFITGPALGLAAFSHVSVTLDTPRDVGAWRFYSVRSSSQMVVTIALPAAQVARSASDVTVEILVMSITSLTIIAILSLWTLSIAVAPLLSITKTARAILAGEKGQRVNLDEYLEDTETGDVAKAFNAVMAAEQQAQDELRQFVDNAAHELRTPLTSISGYAQILRSTTIPDEVRAEARQCIIVEANRMDNIIEDLLQLARLGAGSDMRYELLDLRAIIEDQVQTHLSIDPSYPVAVSGAPSTIEGDYEQLASVINNILSNLRTHTPSGTKATIDLLPKNTTVTIEYRDFGGGAPDTSKLLQRFWRGPETKAGTGTGLGLSILEAAVLAHQGTLLVTTPPGGGLAYTITLPRTHQAQAHQK
jgi:two-component system OmpR family sensor kinase